MNNYYIYVLAFLLLHLIYFYVFKKFEIKKELRFNTNLDYHYKNVLVPA